MEKTKTACSCEHGHSHAEHDDNHIHDEQDCSSHNDSSCGCSSHSHSHDKPATKLSVYLLIAAAILFCVALAPIPIPLQIALFAASVLLGGYDLLLNGAKELFKLKLEENALLLIAVIASFILGEYPEACVVTLLFKLGSFLESSAIARSKKSMESLTKIRPDFACVKNDLGELVLVSAQTVNVNDIIYLRAGDKVALDCQVIEGNSSIDSSALTGEALPLYAGVGDELMSGSINLSGLLRCKVTKSFENSTASQIIKLVYESSQKKGKAENFISRIAKVYTPVIVVLAVLIAVVPPILGLGEFSDFIMRSLIFLVAACPCSLVISIPLSFFSAIGAASKLGVLVKGSMYIEKLSKVNTLCVDKTGTITSGKLEVDSVTSISDYTSDDILQLSANIEAGSTHPIAASIVAYAGNYKKHNLQDTFELAGLGLSAVIDGKTYLCGGKNLLSANKIDTSSLPIASVYLCENSVPVGYITMKEDISPDSLTLALDMEKVGVSKIVMLTGDNEKSASAVAKKCGITEFYHSLLPADKVFHVEELKKTLNKVVLFVGDGINDAPVLAAADISVSMGLGSEIANASSDIVLASNKLSSLSKAISLSKRSMKVVYFNIIFALAIKLVVLFLGAAGYGSMWMAVFADIGVTFLSVLNSIRILRFSKN